MLKNFLKTNFTISLLIILSLIVVINNFFRFFQNNAAYQFDAWLSNYQGGFVRRGLPGELLYQIYDLFNIHLGWMVFIFVCFLYFLFYLTFFYLIKKIKIDKFFIFAFFSPIAFYFPVLNSKATGHKEIIFLSLLIVFCYFLPKIKRFYANCLMILFVLFVGLAHEGLIFYLVYLIIPFFLIYNFRNVKELTFNLAPTIMIVMILFLLNYYFRGSEQHVNDICNSVKQFVNSNCKDVGQIAHLSLPLEGYVLQKIAVGYWPSGETTLYPEYFIIYGTGFVIGFFPLFILFWKAKFIKYSTNSIKMYPMLILLLPMFFTFPIYLIGADWGRYLYISYMSSLIIIIFCLVNNIFYIEKKNTMTRDSIFVKFLFIISIVIYGFGWTVPICCEKKFKPGITQALERTVIYYNRNN